MYWTGLYRFDAERLYQPRSERAMCHADTQPWYDAPFVRQVTHFLITEGLKILWDSICVYRSRKMRRVKSMIHSRTLVLLLKKELGHANPMTEPRQKPNFPWVVT